MNIRPPQAKKSENHTTVQSKNLRFWTKKDFFSISRTFYQIQGQNLKFIENFNDKLSFSEISRNFGAMSTIDMNTVGETFWKLACHMQEN